MTSKDNNLKKIENLLPFTILSFQIFSMSTCNIFNSLGLKIYNLFNFFWSTESHSNDCYKRLGKNVNLINFICRLFQTFQEFILLKDSTHQPRLRVTMKSIWLSEQNEPQFVCHCDHTATSDTLRRELSRPNKNVLTYHFFC